jgi:disease resistance protein RPM1
LEFLSPDRYIFDAETPATKTLVDPRLTASYTEMSKLVGIDKPKKEIIARLTKGDDDQRCESIISIVGFGGLGKTTLAKAVFHEIQEQFDCKAFVSVSRNPDINKLLKGILLKLCMEVDGNIPSANLDVQIEDLIDFISKFLQNKRYVPPITSCAFVHDFSLPLRCGTYSLYTPVYILNSTYISSSPLTSIYVPAWPVIFYSILL